MVMQLIRDDLPSNYDLYLYSDIHVGSKACHIDAFEGMVKEIKSKKNARAVCLGDLIEGQTTDHHHYDHTTVDDIEDFDLHTPDGQFRYFQSIIDPIADRHVGILKGNHDWRQDKVRRFVNHICADLDVPYLGPRAHVTLNDINLYLSHKGRRLTNSAGSPAQRREGMKESLRKSLTMKGGRDFWASAHAMFHGHTHQILAAEPVEPEAQLMMRSDGQHRMRVVDPSIGGGTTSDGYQYVPPQARWYGVTGTFRRSGHFQDASANPLVAWEDYSEKEPYPPEPIGYLRMEVRKDAITGLNEVFV